MTCTFSFRYLDWKAKTAFAGKLVAQQHKCANIGGKKGSTVEEMGGGGLETVSRQTVATVPSSTQRCRTLAVLNTSVLVC